MSGSGHVTNGGSSGVMLAAGPVTRKTEIHWMTEIRRKLPKSAKKHISFASHYLLFYLIYNNKNNNYNYYHYFYLM